MSAEYSVEEVRSRFEAWVSVRSWFKATIGLDRSDDEYADPCINSRWQGWQAAYAESIKADEGAVPVAGQFKRRPEDYPDEWSQCSKEHYDACSRRDGSPWIYRELFAHPPAQAAQVDTVPDPLGCNDCTHPDCGRYNGQRSVECRAMLNNACARPAGNQPYRAPTAEPVAQAGAAEQAMAWFLGEFGDLNPATACLVWNFALALGNKLAAAEKKYGYTDGWRSPDWMDECRTKLMEHIRKGDPRDVAAYCAFAWHHGWSLKHELTLMDLRVIYGPEATTPPAQPAEPVAQGEAVAPNGYHYVYPDIWGTGEVIRKNGGREVDGIKPLRAIPYWYTSPAQPRAVPENCLPFTNEVIDKMQDVMADHGFTVPVRVISDAFRTTRVALLTAAPSPGDSK